jgi:hypothetical protein
MVNPLRCLATEAPANGSRVVGKVAMVLLLCSWSAGSLSAQQPGVHYWHQGVMPPGAIGSRQLQRGGPLPGFFQPVEIKAPAGVLISLAEEGSFGQPQAAPVRAGLLIGQVYRIRVRNIPLNPGLEVFPTVEVIDRTYAPPGQEVQFPIAIQLTLEDIMLASNGNFVTRVIYLEDPRQALPIPQGSDEQRWFEVPPGGDPLAVADQLGRPVAILRLGARLPDSLGPDMSFLFGCPPVVKYPPRGEALPRQPEGELNEAPQSGTASAEDSLR